MRPELSGGLAVVEHFTTLRARILDVLDQTQAAIAETGRPPAEVAPTLALARERIGEDTMTLSVVGAEGHGKSTLLNALLGRGLGEVVPTDPDRPATVAPIEISWGEGKGPALAVDLLGPHFDAKPCADAREFSRYMLQRHNPGNAKRVTRGIVHLDHDYLKRGLTIVDTPGIDGVDADVRAQVTADLHRYTNAIVAVTRDRRGHGSLASIFRDYRVNPRRTLVVVNVDAEHVRGPDVTATLEAKRRGCVDMLAEAGTRMDPARVFVVCLPLMTEARKGADPAHAREVERLRAAVWGQVEAQSLRTVIHDAADLALEALSAVERHLQALGLVLDTVLSGDKAGAERLAALEASVAKALREARHIADAGLFDAARLETEIERGWHAHLEGPVRETGQQTARFLNRKIAGAEALTEVSAAEAASMRQEIEVFGREASVPLDLARNEGLWAFLEDLCGQANRIVAHVYGAAPELEALAHAGHRVSVRPEALPYLRLARARPDLFVHAWKVGVPLGGGVLAASAGTALAVAGAISNPAVALPVLFVLGGGAGWVAASRAMGGRKGDLVRFLNERLRTLDGMSGEAKGPLYEQWRFVCFKVAHLVRTSLDGALTGIGRLLRTDDRSLSTLTEQRARVRAACAGIEVHKEMLRRMMASAGQNGREA